MSFSFKVDPASLPKLSSRGDNYNEWKSAWQITFEYSELWDIVAGIRIRAGSQDIVAWDKSNSKVKFMILSAVHSDLVMTVTANTKAAEVWKALAERFDRDTSTSTIYLFRLIISLRYQDGEDL